MKTHVQPPAPAVHADPNIVGHKKADEPLRGELSALVGVHDQRRRETPEGFFQGLDAKRGIEGV